MTGALRSIIYVSQCTVTLDDDDVYKLYKTAIENNAMEAITGLLVYDGEAFLQVLEGGVESLDMMMAKLRRDPRHRDVEVRDDRMIERRSFGGWAMKLLRIDRAHLAAINNLDDELGPGVDPLIRQAMLDNLGLVS